MDVRGAGDEAAPPPSQHSGTARSPELTIWAAAQQSNGKPIKKAKIYPLRIGELCVFNLLGNLITWVEESWVFFLFQWACNIKGNLKWLLSLLEQFSCMAGWIFTVYVCVYTCISWRVTSIKINALHSTVIFHYILTENKRNQMYTELCIY